MFKTMWNMPATLSQALDAEDHAVPAPLAQGSLAEMVRASEDFEDGDAQGLIITCVGRDRPITWREIKDIRRAVDETA